MHRGPSYNIQAVNLPHREATIVKGESDSLDTLSENKSKDFDILTHRSWEKCIISNSHFRISALLIPLSSAFWNSTQFLRKREGPQLGTSSVSRIDIL